MTSTDKREQKTCGTRPEGVRDEREAADRVQQMFTRIAPRYDFLNHLLSFSLDHVWRARTAKAFGHILKRPASQALDLCCGTGDLTFALERERARGLRGAAGRYPSILGGDFVVPMLERARQKAGGGRYRAAFLAADALSLPFPDASFDLVTSAFGFRNLANYESGLREIARVLKPGGEVGILEFSEPERGAMAAVFRLYFRHILPRIGGAISGSSDAYSYLPASVAKFPAPTELASIMEGCGFAETAFDAWNFGSVILHRGKRAP